MYIVPPYLYLVRMKSYLINMMFYPPYLYPVRMAGETQWEGASSAFISLHPVPFSLTSLDPVNPSSLVIPLQAPHMTDAPGSLHRPT